MDFSSEQYRVYVFLVIALLLLAGVGWHIWCHWKKNRHQRHVEAVIKSLGLPTLRNVVLPDGLDGLAFIDYLLLVPNGAVVLDVQFLDGNLFGGETVDQWSQVVNHRSYKFSNPLYANQGKCQAVMWNVENLRKQLSDSDRELPWETHGWVCFSNAGNFPKGIPEQVSMIDNLASNLAPFMNNADTISAPARKIWDELHNLSVSTRAELAQ